MSEDRAAVAREAARLLYTGACEEYIQAKEAAAVGLGVRATPSNFEVAEELDRLADEAEGKERPRFLIEMREAALSVMKALEGFVPRLIGSVWRGTAHIGSDIDLVAYSSDSGAVREALRGFGIKREGEVRFKGGIRAHRFLVNAAGFEAEVVVRDPADAHQPERCDIYGDPKTGLTAPELERLLLTDPQRRFIPRKRPR